MRPSKLFVAPNTCGFSSATTFGPVLVSKLIARLEGSPLPNLSLNEMAHLIVLVQTTLEVPFHHCNSPSHH